MSEAVTHIAVVEDCGRLVSISRDINEAFKSAFRQYQDIALLGGVTRGGDRHNPLLLKQLRSSWSRDDTQAQRKLAFVLGWLSHRAADRQMKAVFRSADPDCSLSPTDCSIYHDVTVLKEVCSKGSGTFEQALVEADVGGAEELLHAMWRRMLIRMHTFIPAEEDINAWLEGVFAFQQEMRVDITRYAEALMNPDPEKVRRFVTNVNFYDAGDSLIQLAREVQSGADNLPDPGEAAREAVAGSLYARALARAFEYISAADDFWQNRIERNELEERLDIGKPEY